MSINQIPLAGRMSRIEVTRLCSDCLHMEYSGFVPPPPRIFLFCTTHGSWPPSFRYISNGFLGALSPRDEGGRSVMITSYFHLAPNLKIQYLFLLHAAVLNYRGKFYFHERTTTTKQSNHTYKTDPILLTDKPPGKAVLLQMKHVHLEKHHSKT
jgi:hypothetical protein